LYQNRIYIDLQEKQVMTGSKNYRISKRSRQGPVTFYMLIAIAGLDTCMVQKLSHIL
jgi:hypothetical protein